jgi:hypothetical protein
MCTALGTGGAYAANTIGSDDVIDESLTSDRHQRGDVQQGPKRHHADSAPVKGYQIIKVVAKDTDDLSTMRRLLALQARRCLAAQTFEPSHGGTRGTVARKP